MLRDPLSPVRAQVRRAAALVVCVAICGVAPLIRCGGTAAPTVAVEVTDIGRPGRVLLFHESPDRCAALVAAGVATNRCDPGEPLQSGSAVFVMRDGTVRRGWMRGRDLLALGLRLPVNEVSAEDLEAIDGVGPAIAEAIVLERMASGPFRSARDLDRVKGIGPKKAAAIDRYVSYSLSPTGEATPSP